MSSKLSFYIPVIDLLYTLDKRETIIGASAICDLNLCQYFEAKKIRTVSRTHLKIAYIEGEGYLAYDLHSLNGTLVNGEALLPKQPCFLKDGDVIVLAKNEELTIEVISDDFYRTEPLVELSPRRPASVDSQRGVLYLTTEGQFIVDGQRILPNHLTGLEERLLTYLYERSGRTCTYDELIQNVWEYDHKETIQDNSVAKLVSNLRKKLDTLSEGAGTRHIRTVYGRGFSCSPIE